MNYENGDIYAGYWEDGKRHGHGLLNNVSGNRKYEGSFVNDLQEGNGTLSNKTDILFQGSWKAGKYFDGTGELKNYPSRRDIYKGQWMFGLAEGQGQVKYANGNTYKGDWKAGVH